jgi:hypothetical protein
MPIRFTNPAQMISPKYQVRLKTTIFVLSLFLSTSVWGETLPKLLSSRYYRSTLSDLHLVGKGDEDLTDIAEKLGPDLKNARDDNNSNLLHYACFAGQVEMVKKLLSAGVDPNQMDSHGTTPLALASLVRIGHEAEYAEILGLLLKQNISQKTLENALTLSARFGIISSIESIIQTSHLRDLPFSKDTIEWALLEAEAFGRKKAIQTLETHFPSENKGINATIQDICPIDRAKSVIEKNSFQVSRGLDLYLENMGIGLMDAFQSLKQGDHILDSGSGKTVAMREYADPYKTDLQKYCYTRRFERANVTAVTFEISKKAASKVESLGINLLRGRFFEDIPNQEILSLHGPVSMITDYYGVLAYTAKPSEVLRKYIQLLKDDGRIFIHLGSNIPDNFFDYYDNGYEWNSPRHRPSWGSPYQRSGSLNHSRVLTLQGKQIPFPEWLRTVPGLKTTSHLVPYTLAPDYSKNFIYLETYEIELIDREKVVFPNLELVDINENTPAPHERLFQEVNSG